MVDLLTVNMGGIAVNVDWLLQLPLSRTASHPNKTPSTNSKCTRSHSHTHSQAIAYFPALKSLHWLKIEQRIQLKIVSIIYNLNPVTLASLSIWNPLANSIFRSHLSLFSATHIQSQILRSHFSKRFSASLELSSHQSQVFLSTNSYTHLSNTSSIKHTVSFTQSVPLPPQNTPNLPFIPPLNSTPSSSIYGFQPVSFAPLVTRVSSREYTDTIGFTGAI